MSRTILLILLKCFVLSVAFKFQNITLDVFPVNSGIIAAFGHFNSDEFTDVFILQQGGKKLQVFIGSEDGQKFQPHFNCSYNNVITSVVPGDFDGDSAMDILITLALNEDSEKNEIRILWGVGNSVDCKAKNLTIEIVNQPLIVDFNRDMIPDIIGETVSKEMFVWILSADRNVNKINLSNMTNQVFKKPHSSGLIDINNDLAADILLTGNETIELWLNSISGFSKYDSIPYPKSYYDFQLTFVDINSDSTLDIVVPVCFDSMCQSSAIMLWYNNKNISKWEILLDNFKHQNVTWGFKLQNGRKTLLDKASLSVTLRTGDIDMDGYPDFLAILQPNSKKLKAKPVIFQNVPCSNNSSHEFNRCLNIIWDIPGLHDIPNIEIATFFDIYEDGILDILASSKVDHEWRIHALKNAEILDSCFMKVLVLSGLCHNCSFKDMSYGVSQPGPVVQYHMTKQDGHPLVCSAIQNSQTAYFPLQLPYSVFGLGPTPNFIDTLTVAVPSKFNKNVHKREWTQIIPNSQIVIIPHPPEEEKKWVKKLFVTPSHYVFLTCIALIGTCIFIAFIVALLHWRERKEDKKEKMQDAYRFHFDAM